MRTEEFVLPSGVECVVRSMLGDDQDILSNQKNLNDRSAFTRLAAAVLQRVGDNDKITHEFVVNMLSNDLKYLLFRCRNFSLGNPKTFPFTYNWPVKGKQKDAQKYEFDITEEAFEKKPYYWVDEHRDKLISELMEKWDVEDYEDLVMMSNDPEHPANIPDEFIKMFDSYSQIDQFRTQEFKTLEGKRIQWQLSTARAEKNFAKMQVNEITINTPIQMRSPKLILHDKQQNKDVESSWNYRQAEVLDIEKMRQQIQKCEGTFNTTVNIVNQNDDNMNTMVDLVQTSSFFFPSLAT